MKHSRAEGVLVGKVFQRATIKQIEVAGEHRRLHMSNGLVYEIKKDQLQFLVEKQIAMNEKAKAFKQIARLPNGRVQVKLGGQKKGEVKTFQSIGTAMTALDRRYNMAATPLPQRLQQARALSPVKNISAYTGKEKPYLKK